MLEHAAHNPISWPLLACLSAPARVRGEVSRGNEGRGALKPILEEIARRNNKTLEILRCRDSDTEADTVKTFS